MEQQNKLKDTTLRFFHDLFDLMVVNWLWVLCCIPVVTIGPATCGMYTVTLKLAREEPVNPVKDFFRGFKENFKSGLLLGLLAAILLVAAAGDIWLLLRLSGWMQGVYIAVAVLVSGMFLTVTAYTGHVRQSLESTGIQRIQTGGCLSGSDSWNLAGSADSGDCRPDHGAGSPAGNRIFVSGYGFFRTCIWRKLYASLYF